jgi:hypothetical protein
MSIKLFSFISIAAGAYCTPKRHTPSVALPFPLPANIVTRDACSDVTFKILFGEEGAEPRAISFLNAVLNPKTDQERIEKIHFLGTTNCNSKDRVIHFDLLIECECETVAGRRFILEMQYLRHTEHENKWIFNGARELASRGARNQARIMEETDKDSKRKLRSTFYRDLDPVKVVCIMNFDTAQTGLELGNKDDTVVHWNICDNKSKLTINELLSWTFVVLPRFLKRQNAMGNPTNFDTPLDAWLYLMTRGEKEAVTVTNELIAGENEVAQGFHRLSHLTAEEEARLTENEADETAIEAFLSEGRSEGRSEGLAQGLERAAVAMKMLLGRAPTSEILAVSKVTPEVLEQLRSAIIPPPLQAAAAAAAVDDKPPDTGGEAQPAAVAAPL